MRSCPFLCLCSSFIFWGTGHLGAYETPSRTAREMGTQGQAHLSHMTPSSKDSSFFSDHQRLLAPDVTGARRLMAKTAQPSLKTAKTWVQNKAGQGLAAADQTRAKDVLLTTAKPALQAAATFAQQLAPGRRCSAGPMSALAGANTAFGRSRTHPPLSVFVTLSMKDATLKALYRDVAQVGGRLVIRGLIDNSFSKTQQRLRSLKIGVEIDPPAFQAFQVTRVPTFIYTASRGEEEVPAHDRLTGNVTVAYALEAFAQEGTQTGVQDLVAKLGGQG